MVPTLEEQLQQIPETSGKSSEPVSGSCQVSQAHFRQLDNKDKWALFENLEVPQNSL